MKLLHARHASLLACLNLQCWICSNFTAFVLSEILSINIHQFPHYLTSKAAPAFTFPVKPNPNKPYVDSCSQRGAKSTLRGQLNISTAYIMPRHLMLMSKSTANPHFLSLKLPLPSLTKSSSGYRRTIKALMMLLSSATYLESECEIT